MPTIESESIQRTNKDLYFEAMRSGDYSLLLDMKTDIPKSPGVYGIFNKELNKIYIGSSINVQTRIWAHMSSLKTGQHLCSEMNLHFLQSKEAFSCFFIDGIDPAHVGEKSKNLLIFEAKTMLSTPKELLYNNLVPVLAGGEGEFNTDTVITIPVSEICSKIDMTADAIRANGLGFSDLMTLDEAIEFVRKRTVAAGRWTKEKAEKSILYMTELEKIKSESNIQIFWEAKSADEKNPIRSQVRELHVETNPEYYQQKEKLKRVTAETPGAKASPANLKKKNPTDWIRVLALVISGGIVGGHGVLIWYDCSLLWSKPGFIAGLIVFLMILFGMLSMASRTMKAVVENVAWFVWMLEGVAIFVHVPSFTANASQAYARGLGELHIWLLSAIICVCSIGATYFYKQTILIDVKPDKK